MLFIFLRVCYVNAWAWLCFDNVFILNFCSYLFSWCETDVWKERRRRAMDEAMKRWPVDQDGYFDQTTMSLRRLPPQTDKSNGNCVESSDTAPDSPVAGAAQRRAPVTPTIPAHHHLYWPAAGARCHSNATSSTTADRWPDNPTFKRF